MFKERILSVGAVILACSGTILFGVILMWFGQAIHLDKGADMVGAWLRVHPWIFVGFVSFWIVYGIVKFIYWLFIEPFIKKNRER